MTEHKITIDLYNSIKNGASYEDIEKVLKEQYTKAQAQIKEEKQEQANKEALTSARNNLINAMANYYYALSPKAKKLTPEELSEALESFVSNEKLLKEAIDAATLLGGIL